MKKRMIIAGGVVAVLLIAFMGIGGFAQTQSPKVDAVYTATIDFTMNPTGIDFGSLVPENPVTTACVTSAVSVNSNTSWGFTLTTAPALTGDVEAFVIGDTYFTFLQDNASSGDVIFDQATGGFQTNTGVRLANGIRGVHSWDFNYQLSKDFAIPADAYAFPGAETQVFTVAAI